MTTAQHDQQAVEKRLARSYEHPSYDDPYDVVIDYRRVQRATANYPNKGSTALANIVELPRGRIRGWIDDDTDRMPDAVRAITVAHNKGWITPSDETARALSALAGHILGGGSITTQNFVPNVSEGRRVSVPAIQNAFRSVGVQSGRRHAEDETRATEVVPTEYAPILGRTLVAWGCPVGSRSSMTSVPEILDTVDSQGSIEFLEAYILHRAVNYEQKATSRLQGQQPVSFHQAIAKLIETVTEEAASYDSRGVTVSAAAMRALGLDE